MKESTSSIVRRVALAAMVFLFAGVAAAPAAQASTFRIGGGVHYWTAVEDIDIHDIDTSGLSYLASLQWQPVPLLGLEADCEFFPDGFGGSTEMTYAPQAFILVGKAIYGAVGIGVNYADGDFANDPFYVLRVGLNLEFMPHLFLDINGNYQFVTWEGVTDNVSGDTITLGASLRFGF